MRGVVVAGARRVRRVEGSDVLLEALGCVHTGGTTLSQRLLQLEAARGASGGPDTTGADLVIAITVTCEFTTSCIREVDDCVGALVVSVAQFTTRR